MNVRTRLQLGLIMLATALSASAQEGTGAGDHLKFTKAAVQENLLPQLLSAIPAAERKSLGSIRVEVIADGNPHHVALTRRSRATHAVMLSTGFLDAIETINDATVVATKTRRYRDLVAFAQRQAALLGVQSRDRQSKPRRVPPEQFAQYIGWPTASYEAFRRSEEYRSLHDALDQQTLAWVMAHYLEHWRAAARVAPAAADPLASEKAVDMQASELTFAAGYSAIPPLASSVVFAALEHGTQSAAALCRALEIASTGLELSQTDPEASRRLGAATDSARYFADQRKELERLSVATRCADSAARADDQ